jgi:hypothetical protein
MTREEAEDYLGTYRVVARRWSLMLSGMADGDLHATQFWLDNAVERLDQIGTEFPDLARSSALLQGVRRSRAEERRQ